MKLSILSALLLLITIAGFGQKSTGIDIQYITLKDSVLIREVENLIMYEENRTIEKGHADDKVYTENLFKKGIGYIEVRMEKYHSGSPNFLADGDTLYKYYIDPSWYSLKENDSDALYPPFYTYIGGKIVMLHFPIIEKVGHLQYTSRSKKELRRRLEKYLEKPQKVNLKSEDGTLVIRDDKFRIDYFRFEEDGRHIYIIQNRPHAVLIE